jgi:hypothetical protein
MRFASEDDEQDDEPQKPQDGKITEMRKKLTTWLTERKARRHARRRLRAPPFTMHGCVTLATGCARVVTLIESQIPRSTK